MKRFHDDPEVATTTTAGTAADGDDGDESGKNPDPEVTMDMVSDLVQEIKARREMRSRKVLASSGRSGSGSGSGSISGARSLHRVELVASCVHGFEASMLNCFGLSQLHQVRQPLNIDVF